MPQTQNPEMGAPMYHGHLLYEDNSSSIGFVVGVILAAIIAILLLAYAIPALENTKQQNSVGVPDQIEIRTNSGQSPALLQ